MTVRAYWKFFISVIIPILFFLCILLCLPIVCGHSHSHEHEHDHGHSHHHPEQRPSFKWSKEANEGYQEGDIPDADGHSDIKLNSNGNMWFEAIGATLLISIAPYLILFVIPVTNTKEHEPYLKILLAFASGGLLGDAFLHLIPHALMAAEVDGGGHSHSHSHGHSHGSGEHVEHHSHNNTVGVSVLAGIIVFLIIEKFVRIFKGGHCHSHNQATSKNGPAAAATIESKKNGKPEKKPLKKGQKPKGESNMKVTGYLNLAADFAHNLTDGLAIGASFLAGRSVGIVTTFTIFLHEIPHEIGDFAILIQSGCSKKKAMLLQLLTAVGAIIGTLISLMAEGADDTAVSWILPFTAGGFIYIATVSVIPELLENSHFWQSLCEVTALLLGVGLMVIITWLEEIEPHT